MAIVVQCPGCGVSSPAADSFSGRSVRCKKCGKPFVAEPTLDGARQSDTKRSQPAAADNPFPTLPAEFGRYRVEKLLGKGGMGAVYLAEDTQLRRPVALKIPFFGAGESGQRAERFVREAQSAAGLSHANICTVFDAGRIAGRPFISMAHIAGTSLEAHIDPDVPMPQPRAAEIAHRIALALDHAHEKGIVHRDLKPANVMLNGKGEPVVMDFGLAKRAGLSDLAAADGTAPANPNEAKLTREGGLLGTPSYMSPEQARGDLARIGPATDIYSLGVMLFEMLAGRPPYVGSLPVLMGKILNAPVPPVREFRADADPRLDAICRTAMAKSPAARFPSMAAFAQALGDYLDGADTCSVELVEPEALPRPVPQVVVPPPMYRSAPAPAADPFDRLTEPAPRKKKPGKRSARNPWIGRGIGIAIALAVLLPAAWVASYLLRIETPNGTLVVEVNDDEVGARLKAGKLVLSGPDGKEKYTLSPNERNKKLDAGAYTIRVVGADGLALDTTEFTLRKGDKVTIRVTLAKKVVAKLEEPKNETPVADDPDRMAAEYVLSIGGKVRVNDEVDDIARLENLPSKPFTLSFVDLAYNKKMRNAKLDVFRGCKHVKILKLGATQIKDTGLANFKQCKELEELSLHESEVSDAGLAYFRGCLNVKALLLNHTKVTDTGLAYFNECEKLTSLGLFALGLKGEWLAQAKYRDSLEVLDVSYSKFTDQSLSSLKKCKSFKLISLCGNLITDTGLANLEGCLQLEHLCLAETAIGDEGLAHFKDCVKLKSLRVHVTKTTDKGLAYFQNCQGLEYIDQAGSKVTSQGIAAFQRALPKCRIDIQPNQREAALQPPGQRNGFIPLFNGKDLTGWTVDGASKKAEWKIADGAVSVAGGPPPTWGFLLTEKDYTDFVLRLQFQQRVAGAKSGIVVRGIPGQRFLKLPYQCKVNLRTADDTGALLWSNDSTYHPRIKPASLKAAGEWNDMEVELRGQQLRVTVNGVIVQEVKLDDLAGSPKALTALKRAAGRIGFQKAQGDVAFRNVEIKEFAAGAKVPPAERIMHCVQTRYAAARYGPDKLRLTADGVIRTHRNEPLHGTWKLSDDGKKLVLEWKKAGAPGGMWVDTYTSNDGVEFDGSNNDQPPRRMAARLSGTPTEAELADDVEKDQLRVALIGHTWHYADPPYPPTTACQFFEDGTFHSTWRWRYWVVGPTEMRVRYDKASDNWAAGVRYTFNDDLTRFAGEFTDEKGRVHRITGTRNAPR